MSVAIPFFLESSGSTYLQRVERTVLTVIDKDIPAVADIEYETQLKLKKLLVVLADQVPFVPNISKPARESNSKKITIFPEHLNIRSNQM